MHLFRSTSIFCCGSMASLIAMAILLGTQSLYADLDIINDGLSDPSSYSIGSANSLNPDDISTVAFQFLNAGGNPDGFFSVTHNHDVQRDGNGEPPNRDGLVELFSFFTYLPTTYTPSVSGSIETISFSLDVRYDDLEADFNRLFFFVEDQDGSFLGGNADLSTSSEWQTITVEGLTELAFPGIDFSGSSPLSFGFGFVSNVDVFGGALSSTVDADNFRVSITTVPEPGSMSLLTIFTGMALLRHRRSSTTRPN